MGAANMANTTQKKKQPKKPTEKTAAIPKVRLTWDERQLLDPMNPSALKKLKKKFETIKFNDVGWKQHCTECNNLTYNSNSDKLCYTCVTVECWAARKQEW